MCGHDFRRNTVGVYIRMDACKRVPVFYLAGSKFWSYYMYIK